MNDADIHVALSEPTVEDQLRSLGVTRVDLTWEPSERGSDWTYEFFATRGETELSNFDRVNELEDVIRAIRDDLTDETEEPGF